LPPLTVRAREIRAALGIIESACRELPAAAN